MLPPTRRPQTAPPSGFPLLSEDSFARQVENSLEKIRDILNDNKVNTIAHTRVMCRVQTSCSFNLGFQTLLSKVVSDTPFLSHHLKRVNRFR